LYDRLKKGDHIRATAWRCDSTYSEAVAWALGGRNEGQGTESSKKKNPGQ